MPVPIHYVSQAIGSYLTALYGARNAGGGLENPWRLLGTRPSEAGAVADQMVSNGSYFTSYACAGTYRLLAAGGAQYGPVEERRKLYAGLLGPLRRTTRKARFVRAARGGTAAGARRDGSGRLRLGEKSQGWVRKKFYEAWVLPPTDHELEKRLVESLGKLDGAREGSLAACLRGVLERVLDEVRLYQELRREAEAAEERGEASRELMLLEDYRALLPIWVYTQRTHAHEECEGLPVNLYNLDFWSYRPFAEDGEGRGSLPALVDDLRSCFEQDAQLAGQGLVERFVQRVDDLFEQCARDDESGGPSLAFEDGCDVDTPSVRELLARLQAGEKGVVPAWAVNRAELIWLIMVSSCVGLEAALGGGGTQTADELAAAEELLDSDELGRGSGVVPLSSRVGSHGAGSLDLDLGDEAGDEGVVCVLGRERDPGFWTPWAVRAKELLGEFFLPETHLDATASDGLPAQLRDAAIAHFDLSTREGAEALGSFARLEAVGSGRLDVAGMLVDAAVRALGEGLRESFDSGYEPGQGSALDLGTDERSGAGTLVGAARAAAEELNRLLVDELRAQRESEYARTVAALDEEVPDPEERALREREARKRRDARVPSVRAAVSRWLERVLEGYFDQQRALRGRDSGPAFAGRSRLDVLLDQLEDEYAARYGHDPSMRLAVGQLRDGLVRLLSPARVKVISRRKVCASVDEVFSSLGKAEGSRYLTLPSADVSARHAVLYLSGGRLMLADAGSLQGTAVIRERREPSQGAALVREEALVLEGTGRRLNRMLDATWMPSERREVPEVELRRGDVIRLAGQTVVRVGGAS